MQISQFLLNKLDDFIEWTGFRNMKFHKNTNGHVNIFVIF